MRKSYRQKRTRRVRPFHFTSLRVEVAGLLTIAKHHAILLFAIESILGLIKRVTVLKVHRQPVGVTLTTLVTVPPYTTFVLFNGTNNELDLLIHESLLILRDRPMLNFQSSSIPLYFSPLGFLVTHSLLMIVLPCLP